MVALYDDNLDTPTVQIRPQRGGKKFRPSLAPISGNTRPLASPPSTKKAKPVVLPTIGPDDSPSSSIGSATRAAHSPSNNILASPFFLSPPASQLQHSGLTPAMAQLHLNGEACSPSAPSSLRASNAADAKVAFRSALRKLRRHTSSVDVKRIGLAAAGVLVLAAMCVTLSSGSDSMATPPLPASKSSINTTGMPSFAVEESDAIEQAVPAVLNDDVQHEDIPQVEMDTATATETQAAEEDADDDLKMAEAAVSETTTTMSMSMTATDVNTGGVVDETNAAPSFSGAHIIDMEALGLSVRDELLRTAEAAARRAALETSPSVQSPHNHSYYVCPATAPIAPVEAVEAAEARANDQMQTVAPVLYAVTFSYSPTDRYTGPVRKPQFPRCLPTCGLTPLPWTNASIASQRDASAAKPAFTSIETGMCEALASPQPSTAQAALVTAHAADFAALEPLDDTQFDARELDEAEATIEAEASIADFEIDGCTSTDLGNEVAARMLMAETASAMALAAPAAPLEALVAVTAVSMPPMSVAVTTFVEASSPFVLLGDAPAAVPPMTLLPVRSFLYGESPKSLSLVLHATANTHQRTPNGRTMQWEHSLRLVYSHVQLPAYLPAPLATVSDDVLSLMLDKEHAAMEDAKRSPTVQRPHNHSYYVCPAIPVAPVEAEVSEESQPVNAEDEPDDAPIEAPEEETVMAGEGDSPKTVDDEDIVPEEHQPVVTTEEPALTVEEEATMTEDMSSEPGTIEWTSSVREQLSPTVAEAMDYAQSVLVTLISKSAMALDATIEMYHATGIEAQMAQEWSQLKGRLPEAADLGPVMDHFASLGRLAQSVDAPPVYLWLATLGSAALALLAVLLDGSAAEGSQQRARSGDDHAGSSPSRATPATEPPSTPIAYILQPWVGTASTAAPSPADAPLSGVTVSSVCSTAPWRQLSSSSSTTSAVSEATHAAAAEARALLEAAVDDGFDNDINPIVLFDLQEPVEEKKSEVVVRRASLRQGAKTPASQPRRSTRLLKKLAE